MPLFHLSAAPTVLAPMLVGGTSVLADRLPSRPRCGTRYAACGAVGFRRSRRDGVDAVEPAAGPARCYVAAAVHLRSADRREFYHDIEKRYGCRIVTMYGMTEAFPIAVKGVSEDGIPGNLRPAESDFRRADRRLRRQPVTRGYGRGDRLPGPGIRMR